VPYSERFFMGGEGSLRGFDFRGVGPVQFGQPIGGEMSVLGTAEYRFPLFATRLPGRDEEIEVLRGAIFTDVGTLQLDVGDPPFGDLRASTGIGVRIRIPFLPQLPIAIHLGYPWLREDTDDTRTLSFTIGNF
jgi:outer membrane protein insertion porin family